jgi:hypothetical protein
MELSKRIDTLFIKEGRGAKPKLDSIKEELPDLLERYNGKYLSSFELSRRIMEKRFSDLLCRNL